jgi:predicted RNase H-like HicB family nuclease
MVVRFIVEHHSNGFIAYPIGIQGMAAGQGKTYDEALENAKSALKFHIETFGEDVLKSDSLIIEAKIEEEIVE